MADSSSSWDYNESKEFKQKIDALSGQSDIALSDLFPDSFIQKHSEFQTLHALIDASGIENTEDIGNESFSVFISTHTNFASWEEIVKVATAEYVKRKLGS